MRTSTSVSLVILLFLWLGQVTPVRAAFKDGNDLHNACQQTQEGIEGLYCMGYIVAIADVLESGSSINGFRACLRQNMRAGQVVDVVKRWLQDHPQDRDYGAPGLVAAALQDAFPCPK
jgi:Rap1a immunity proteins